jgi:hypothetical protein
MRLFLWHSIHIVVEDVNALVYGVDLPQPSQNVIDIGEQKLEPRSIPVTVDEQQEVRQQLIGTQTV